MPKQRRGKARVLLVEDDPIIAMDLEERLRGLGFEEVVVASDYPSVRDLLRAQDYDLVLFDLNLDGVSSLPLVEEQARNGSGVVVTSGYKDGHRTLAALGVPVLVKPIQQAQLSAAVEDLGL